MKILIVADSEQKQGGTNEVIKDLIQAIGKDNHEIIVDYINREKYLPRYLPKRLIDLFRIFYLRNICNDDDFKEFDIVISLQPDSHCIRHRNHIIYFQHHIKQYYDMFWYSFQQRKKMRKKIIFLLLTAINRFADKIYLTSNLKKAHVIVNSHTVGERLKKYNHIFNFTIINPSVHVITGALETTNIQNKEVIMKELKEIHNHEYVILSFSRLNVPQKGIDVILKTALLMPFYHFIIAGPYDVTMETIDRKSIPKNIHLIIKDFSEEEKADLFKRCDVFIAPYVNEDFGITPIEANSFGKPVIYCYDSGEIVYTQKHKTTGYMSSRNPNEITEGIEYCLKYRECMKYSCIENASKYTEEKFRNSFRKHLFE